MHCTHKAQAHLQPHRPSMQCTTPTKQKHACSRSQNFRAHAVTHTDTHTHTHNTHTHTHKHTHIHTHLLPSEMPHSGLVDPAVAELLHSSVPAGFAPLGQPPGAPLALLVLPDPFPDAVPFKCGPFWMRSFTDAAPDAVLIALLVLPDAPPLPARCAHASVLSPPWQWFRRASGPWPHSPVCI
jgi:hypothetical protein